MIALVLAAVISSVPDGGTKLVSNIYGSCPEAPEMIAVGRCEGDGICSKWPLHDGGFFLAPFSWPYEEDAGFLMSHQRARRVSCFVGACEANRLDMANTLKDSGPPPSWQYWAAGLTTMLIVGFSAGYVCKSWEGCPLK